MAMFARWRMAAAAVVVAASVALSACVLWPGSFESTLDLRRDGRFTFSYQGEIHLLALSKLADMARETEQDEEFIAAACWDEDYNDRECTAEEVAEQREAWEAEAEDRRARAERDAESMRRLLGGIDSASPQAAEELVTRLRRQEGWKQVEYRGDGLFVVDFSITSRFGHDFAFPTIERFPLANAFVIANARQGRTVRIEAPGFSTQGGSNPFQGMPELAALGAAAASEGSEFSAIPEMNGTFRIVTDGSILANNTDEGPCTSAEGQVLEWRINRRTDTAPMALIQLGG